MKKIVLVFTLLAFVIMGVNAQTPWYLEGNAGTNPSSNFIGTTDNNPLIFKTAGNERMKLLSDKSFLGIGVSTPQATLHLHYQDWSYPTLQKLLQLTTNATGNGDGNGFSIISNYDTKDILFKQNETAKFFVEGPGGGFVIAPTGKIGVGTVNPKEKLHIAGSILTEGEMIVQDKISLIEGNHAWEIEITNDGLNFMHGLSTGLERGISSKLFINNNGNIGVGTNTPSTKLDVNGLFSAQNANINTLTTNELNAQSATIANTLTAQSANINGKIKTKEIQVTLRDWPDFVFSKEYQLPTLKEVEQFITENQHLPNVPSAAEVEKNGVDLGEMNATLLKKVEELTLYILDLQKQIDELKTK